MIILIKEKECTYISDYPNGWTLSPGEHFKSPVTIRANPPYGGEYLCFIKRFEKKDPASISGWGLLVKLEHKFEPNLARVHDIASVEENGKRIYYVVYEYLEGSTLDKLVAGNTEVNLTRLTEDLFSALSSLEKFQYWFADLTEKNILVQPDGRSVLMDLDSAQPFSRPPADLPNISGHTWTLISQFYKNIPGYEEVNPVELSGLALNQLQVIFIILQLRLSYDKNLEQYRPLENISLAEVLDKIDPSFKKLFKKVYDQRRESQYNELASEMRELIITKIIPYEYPRAALVTPEIKAFVAEPETVEKGQSFSLGWKVCDATSIELFKNGNFDSRYSPLEKGTEKSIFYDGSSRTVSYKLIAINGSQRVESDAVEIRIVDKLSRPAPERQPDPPIEKKIAIVPPAPRPVNDGRQEERKAPPPAYAGFNEIVKRYFKVISLSLAVLLILAIILLTRIGRDKTSMSPLITSINPRVAVDSPIVINGKNFPTDTKTIQVLINKTAVSILAGSDNKLEAAYPKTLDALHSEDRSARRVIIDPVDVIIGDDTLHAELRVLRNLTFQHDTPVTEEAENPEETTALPAIRQLTNREKKILDSIGLVQAIRKTRTEAGIIDPRKQMREAIEKRMIDSINSIRANRQ